MTDAAPASVLLVHGAGAGGWEWAIWQRVLAARGWRTTAPDLQPAAAGLAATGLQDYVAQVRATAQLLAAPRVLVGASLGGLLALAVAGEVGAAALVLVNPLPPAPWASLLPQRSRDGGALVHWGRDASLEGTRRALPDCDEAACRHAYRRWRDESARVLEEAHAGIALPAPGCPMLVLASEHDSDVPPAVSLEFARHQGAELRMLPGASHVGPLLGGTAAQHAAAAEAWLAQVCGKLRG